MTSETEQLPFLPEHIWDKIVFTEHKLRLSESLNIIHMIREARHAQEITEWMLESIDEMKKTRENAPGFRKANDDFQFCLKITIPSEIQQLMFKMKPSLRNAVINIRSTMFKFSKLGKYRKAWIERYTTENLFSRYKMYQHSYQIGRGKQCKDVTYDPVLNIDTKKDVEFANYNPYRYIPNHVCSPRTAYRGARRRSLLYMGITEPVF